MKGIFFHDDVPKWLRAHVTRWVKRLRLDNWRIDVTMVDPEQFTTKVDGTTLAECYALTEYKSAHIYFHEDLANKPEAEWVVAHELRHIQYQAILDICRWAWDGRRKVDRDVFADTLDKAIHDLIDTDVDVLMQLAKGKNGKS